MTNGRKRKVQTKTGDDKEKDSRKPKQTTTSKEEQEEEKKIQRLDLLLKDASEIAKGKKSAWDDTMKSILAVKRNLAVDLDQLLTDADALARSKQSAWDEIFKSILAVKQNLTGLRNSPAAEKVDTLSLGQNTPSPHLSVSSILSDDANKHHSDREESTPQDPFTVTGVANQPLELPKWLCSAITKTKERLLSTDRDKLKEENEANRRASCRAMTYVRFLWLLLGQESPPSQKKGEKKEIYERRKNKIMQQRFRRVFEFLLPTIFDSDACYYLLYPLPNHPHSTYWKQDDVKHLRTFYSEIFPQRACSKILEESSLDETFKDLNTELSALKAANHDIIQKSTYGYKHYKEKYQEYSNNAGKRFTDLENNFKDICKALKLEGFAFDYNLTEHHHGTNLKKAVDTAKALVVPLMEHAFKVHTLPKNDFLKALGKLKDALDKSDSDSE